MALEGPRPHIRHDMLLIVVAAGAESFNLRRQGKIHNRPIDLLNPLLFVHLMYPLQLDQLMMRLIRSAVYVVVGIGLDVDNVGDASPLDLLLEAEHDAVSLVGRHRVFVDRGRRVLGCLLSRLQCVLHHDHTALVTVTINYNIVHTTAIF